MKKSYLAFVFLLSQTYISGCETVTEQNELAKSNAKVIDGKVDIDVTHKIRPGMTLEELKAESKASVLAAKNVHEALKSLDWVAANKKARLLMASEPREGTKLYIAAYMLKPELLPEKSTAIKEDMLFYIKYLTDSGTLSINTYAPALQRLKEIDPSFDARPYAQKGLLAYQAAKKEGKADDRSGLKTDQTSDLKLIEALAK